MSYLNIPKTKEKIWEIKRLNLEKLILIEKNSF